MQKAFQFDQETIKKIGRGALIAGSGAGAIAFLQFFDTIEFTDPVVASVVAGIISILINAVREWMKGA